MSIPLPIHQIRVLLAMADGGTFKVHRDLDGHKDYMLHPLEGRAWPVEPEDAAALVEAGMLDSNMKFPAATFGLTTKSRAVVAEVTAFERNAILTPKNLRDLTYQDYHEYPIWGFADDDDSEVEPVGYPGQLVEPTGGSGWFVLCEFLLADGTRRPGVVCVRTTDHAAYVLEFFGADGKLLSFPVNSSLEGTVTREQVAAFLGKPVAAVFPLRYITPFTFSDGEVLEGQYS